MSDINVASSTKQAAVIIKNRYQQIRKVVLVQEYGLNQSSFVADKCQRFDRTFG